ncbi:hypothetical protein N9B82_01215 [Saprospiraceae bacterium]|nr:hypothetical protein [Saprospiraceae bacterium]
MKQIKFVLPFMCFIFMGFLATAQTAQKTVAKETAKTEMTKTATCQPAACDALVLAGLCSPQQAAACKKTCGDSKMAAKTDAKTTKVASASKKRGEAVAVKASGNAKKKGCTQTCKSAKKD